MSQLTLRPVFHGARGSHSQTPSAFFQSCRNAATLVLRHDRSLHTSTRRPMRPSATVHDETISIRSSPRIGRQVRRFSNTTPVGATIVKLNPRKDDEGHDMIIDISERAAKQLRQITGTPPKRNTLTESSPAAVDHHLRITVTSGGCHGFQYQMALRPEDEIDGEEDTVFESSYELPSEEKADAKGWALVVMDEPSLELLKGSTVDFTKALIGSEFKIVGNPRAKSSCGCGTSFDID